MVQFKIPGAYVVEPPSLPTAAQTPPDPAPFAPPVVDAATGIAAFVGYTQFAHDGSQTLADKPVRIASMAEFARCFGGAPHLRFSLDATRLATAAVATAPIVDGFPDSAITTIGTCYRLYDSVQWFFMNGGSVCYIVSVGSYDDTPAVDRLGAGISALSSESEPALLLVPDAVCLSAQDCFTVQRAMLAHCGTSMRRFAVLDIHDGFTDRQDPDGDVIASFRAGIGNDFLNFGAAYYPWIDTALVQDAGIDFTAIGNLADLAAAIRAEREAARDASVSPAVGRDHPDGWPAALDALARDRRTMALADAAADIALADKTLRAQSMIYAHVMAGVTRKRNRLPPAAGVAGAYAMIDSTRGVWTAPANCALVGAVAPGVAISDDAQQDLNAPADGKAVNAIRAFTGVGLLVWGARTLDGNSVDWRYINVRRTILMIETSLRTAFQAYAHQPNTSETWRVVKGMTTQYLTNLWQQGALSGASAADAFAVAVGVGESMHADDVLAGVLRVNVNVALSHPDEFIELNFSQTMQTS